jgi:hypothetical protein
MRESLDARLHVACRIADDPEASNTDRLRALDFLARYGLGTQTENENKSDGRPLTIEVRHLADDGTVESRHFPRGA